jgi:predicted nucleotidyltransferase
MGLPSKEESVVRLFFNEPSKQWHFEQIITASTLSRSKTNKWLGKLVQERIIRRVKPRGKMPYFQADFESAAYRTRKRLFAIAQLQESGFLDHLVSLSNAKTIIIFGSFVRADWYTQSEIDVFIFGTPVGLDIEKYSHTLKRDIQLFEAKDCADLEKFGKGLLRNIIEGMLVKGKLDFVEVTPLAKV